MAIEIVDFPMKNGDFSIVTLVYQRVVMSILDSTPGLATCLRSPLDASVTTRDLHFW